MRISNGEPAIEPRYLTDEQAATYLQCSTKTIRRLVSEGHLIGCWPVRGSFRIDRESIDLYCLKRTKPPRGRRGQYRREPATEGTADE